MIFEDCAGCEDCLFDIKQSSHNFHEIHITVETNQPMYFKKICEENNIKPILIQFQNENLENKTHVMTSQRITGSDVKNELHRMLDVFNTHFKVLRIKIETSLLNSNKMITPNGYFESHLSFNVKNRKELSDIASKLNGVRLSTNAFKKNADFLTYMITMRDYNTTGEKFLEKMKNIREVFSHHGFESDKLIVEYCWYDTNINLDNEWKIE